MNFEDWGTDALTGVNLSTDQLTKMAGRALQPLLVPLQKLQACACGNSEKYAQQILQMFEAEGGTVEDLKDACSGNLLGFLLLFSGRCCISEKEDDESANKYKHRYW